MPLGSNVVPQQFPVCEGCFDWWDRRIHHRLVCPWARDVDQGICVSVLPEVGVENYCIRHVSGFSPG